MEKPAPFNPKIPRPEGDWQAPEPTSKRVDAAWAREDPIASILRELGQGERFLVCSHSRPDGDAVGSMLAFSMLLEQMGKRADLVTADGIPAQYRRFPGAADIRSASQVHGPYDAVILLECDGLERAQLDGLEEYFLINIDHHISAHAYANLNWIDCQAASVGEMVYRLAKAASVPITPPMAACLYVTLLTDTGGFCYGSVRASTFGMARDLVLAGADPVRIAQEVCFSNPVSKMHLLGTALKNLQCKGELAWLWVSQHDMESAGAAEEDCEGIVNFALGIAGVEAAMFLRELPDGRFRLSLRSKGRINVAAIAESLGGGGHENAAGCTVAGPRERALAEILARLRSALEASDPP
jgi:bifunctional oligoribonuclease and PAP phosphatase NrnA